MQQYHETAPKASDIQQERMWMAFLEFHCNQLEYHLKVAAWQEVEATSKMHMSESEAKALVKEDITDEAKKEYI